MTLTLHTDRTLIRSSASSIRYLLAQVSAPEAPRRETRLPVNISIVLDRSGSMAGDEKFPLAVEAVTRALAMLDQHDRFSLVVFDEQVDVISRSSAATGHAKRAALDALRIISPRGSTDLCAGWMHGCDEVAEAIADGVVSRALLLTDGLANHGIVDRGTLVSHALELQQRGIATSTFGVGADFDEHLLRDIASSGGGNFYYLQNAAQIPDLMTSELGEALEVVIPSAGIDIDLPEGARAEVLNRFRTEQRGTALRVFLGDLVSAQEINLVVRVKFPRGRVGDSLTVRAALVGGEQSRADARTTWTFADHQANDVQPRNPTVDREVAVIYAARARAEATEANRNGDFEHARRVLEGTARRIREYAGSNRELRDLATALVNEVPRYAEVRMSASMLKGAFYEADLAWRERAVDGKAKRRQQR